MKNFKENEMMKEMNMQEVKNVNGGADYLYYNDTNPIIYTGIAFYNAGVMLYNLVTGEEGGVKRV